MTPDKTGNEVTNPAAAQRNAGSSYFAFVVKLLVGVAFVGAFAGAILVGEARQKDERGGLSRSAFDAECKRQLQLYITSWRDAAAAPAARLQEMGCPDIPASVIEDFPLKK